MINKEQLEQAISDGLSSYGIARKFNVGQTAARYWLKRWSLKTQHKAKRTGKPRQFNPCVVCGTPTKNKRVCGLKCNGILTTATTQKRWQKRNCQELASWKQGKFQPSEFRCKAILVFERGKKCEICGWAEVNPYTDRIPIELEHKDGDCYNNKYENLSLLCPNHQSLTATYRGANARRGRGRKMYKVVSQWAKEKGIGITTGT
jgi:predicted nucleic acid-binding Zn ribbon protein